MEFRKSDHIIFFFKPLFLLLFTLLMVLNAGDALSQEKSKETKEKSKKKKKSTYEVKVSLDAKYDDNILKYSEKYLERFMNGLDYGRFHIETYDDVILTPSVSVAGNFKIFGKLNSRFNADFSHNQYIVNNIKTWDYFSLGYQQNLTKKASFKILYSYIPEFYVRHFRDEDLVRIYGYTPETFVPFSFSKDNLGFWIQNTYFKNTRIRLTFSYAKYYHNQHYTEYDCDNLTYGIQIIQPVNKTIKLEAGFEYTTSNAKGYDNTTIEGFYTTEETKENSDDADATNREESYWLGCSWQIPDVLKLKHSLDAKIGYDRRNYTTDDGPIEDPEHAGRLDQNMNLAFTYSLRLNKKFSVSAYYKFFGRDSSTSSIINSNYVSNEKDYKQNQVGLSISYNLKF
jgi:hypothetical protein